MILAAVLSMSFGSGAALAQAGVPDKVLTPAPVPDRTGDRGAPADRAGRIDGADRAAPFSGLPSSIGAGSGQGTPATLGAPEKDSTPAPSVSR